MITQRFTSPEQAKRYYELAYFASDAIIQFASDKIDQAYYKSYIEQFADIPVLPMTETMFGI